LPGIKKILIIRFSSFGDIVLTYPFISKLRSIYPDAQIDFYTKVRFSPLVKMHKDINNVIEYNGEKISGIRKVVKENNYDLIFDIHKNIRSIFSTVLLHSRLTRYKKFTFRKLLLVCTKINLLRDYIPVYKSYFFALKNIKNLVDTKFINTDLKFDREPVIKSSYILVAPSSKHFTKAFPVEKFEQVFNVFKNEKIVLIGDDIKNDREICEYLSGKFENSVNYCGKTDFYLLANLIHNSKLVLCNDSGVLHLAEALNKKIITFFGSTVKELGFYPQLKSTIVFENNSLKCRPCTHIGRETCPKKHFKCMNEINTDEIIIKINENIS
jgi:ADP-heptose:LPS heptosyltransferase